MSARPEDGPAAPGASAAEGRFNVSAAALRHPQLTLFFLMVVAIAGSLAFFKLGQREEARRLWLSVREPLRVIFGEDDPMGAELDALT